MKKLFLALAVVSSTLYAEPIQVTAICGGVEELRNILNKYGEKAMLNFSSYRLEGENIITYPTTMFVNPKEGSFTIVEKRDSDVFCVVTTGVDLQPSTGNNK